MLQIEVRIEMVTRFLEAKVLTDVSAGQVLNFPIAPGEQGLGSIRAFLSQQDWYTASMLGLADPARCTGSASSLCRTIVNEITGIGLNSFDAAIVVWAVAKGMPLSEGASLDAAPDRMAMIQKLERAQQQATSVEMGSETGQVHLPTGLVSGA